MAWRLYTTLGCHLCEQLAALVILLARDRVDFERIEIAEDEALMAGYASRIPVLIDEQGKVVLEGNVSPEAVADELASRGLLDEAAWDEWTVSGADQDGPTFAARDDAGRRTLGRND